MGRVQSVRVPGGGLIEDCMERIDYADAFRVAVSDEHAASAETLAARVFASLPRWIGLLMRLRNSIVGPLGLKTTPAAGERIGFFRVFARTEDEFLLGEDDKHLDFRVSVRIGGAPGARHATVTTLVRFHNRLGRLYFFLVRPFHKVIVPAVMKGAVH